jgi:hypothetical protein
MSVNDLKCGRIRYREVVWCDTDERPYGANFRCCPEDPKVKFSAVGAYHTSRASGEQLLNGARVLRRGLTRGQRSGPVGVQGMIAGHGDQRARE